MKNQLIETKDEICQDLRSVRTILSLKMKDIASGKMPAHRANILVAASIAVVRAAALEMVRQESLGMTEIIPTIKEKKRRKLCLK